MAYKKLSDFEKGKIVAHYDCDIEANNLVILQIN